MSTSSDLTTMLLFSIVGAEDENVVAVDGTKGIAVVEGEGARVSIPG